jgi:hypothetical protein
MTPSLQHDGEQRIGNPSTRAAVPYSASADVLDGLDGLGYSR